MGYKYRLIYESRDGNDENWADKKSLLSVTGTVKHLTHYLIFFLFYINIRSMNARTQRARQIMEIDGCCTQINRDTFKVRSQTNPDNFYIMKNTPNFES